MYRRGRLMSPELDQQLVELCGSTGRSGFIELRRLRGGIGGDTEKPVTWPEPDSKARKATRYASKDGFKNRIATYQNEKNQGRYKIHRFEQQKVDIRQESEIFAIKYSSNRVTRLERISADFVLAWRWVNWTKIFQKHVLRFHLISALPCESSEVLFINFVTIIIPFAFFLNFCLEKLLLVSTSFCICKQFSTFSRLGNHRGKRAIFKCIRWWVGRHWTRNICRNLAQLRELGYLRDKNQLKHFTKKKTKKQ